MQKLARIVAAIAFLITGVTFPKVTPVPSRPVEVQAMSNPQHNQVLL